MGEKSNKFKKGMNQDIHPAEQLEQTYREAINFTLLSEEGNIYALTNEDGTVLMDKVTFPAGMKLIGYDVLNNDIIVFLAGETQSDGTAVSQMGYIREDSTNLDPDYGYYHPVAPIDPAFDPDTDNPRDVWPEDNTEFAWTREHPLDIVSRKLINGSRVVYYTDNVNPFGRIELEDPPEVGQVPAQSRLVFDQDLPIFTLVEVRDEVAGSLRPGVYQFITRYITDNGGTTTFGIPSNQVPIIPTNDSEGVSAQHGEFYENVEINKNIILEISNVDQNYQELELIVCYYDQGTAFTARSVAKLPITSDTLNFTFTGPETGEETALSQAELRQIPVSYKRAKCIEQKDNRLFLSNLSDDALDNEALQLMANHITVDYAIKEVAYSGREGVPVASSQSGFTDVSIVYAGPNQVLVTFSEPTWPDFEYRTGSNIYVPGFLGPADIRYGSDDHLLTTDTPAKASIDATNAADGDTIQLGTETYTAVATLTDPDNPGFEFEIDDPNVNLAIAINRQSNEYAARLDDNDLIEAFAPGDNTDAITYTGSITGDAAFSGGDPAEVEYKASNIELVGADQLLYTFNGATIGAGAILASTQIFPAGPEENTQLLNPVTASPSGPITIQADEENSSVGDTAPESFTDYVDEKVCFDFKGYRRGEAYSLGVVLIFKDGTTSNVYHIPGRVPSSDSLGKEYPDLGGDTYNVGQTSGPLGTYVSEREYPLEQFYPGDRSEDDNTTQGTSSYRRNVRHHVMPTLNQEPHFRRSGLTASIRIIGLKFTIDPAFDIPEAIAADVEEIMFVRERRNEPLNKSVYAQGFINRMVETADHCDNGGRIDGSSTGNVRNSYCLQEMPFFNNLTNMTVYGDNVSKSSGHSRRGVCWPGAFASQGSFGQGPGESFDNGFQLATEIRGNRAFFHSPETILNADTDFTDQGVVGGDMVPWLLMTGEATTTVQATTFYKSDAGDDWCDLYGYHDMHGNYRDYDTNYVFNTSSIRRISDAAQRPAGVRRNNGIGSDLERPNDTTTRWTQGGLEVFVINDNAVNDYVDDADKYQFSSVNSEHLFIDPGHIELEINHQVYAKNKATICISSCSGTANVPNIRRRDNQDFLPSGTVLPIQNHLYNIELENNVQYGDVTQAKFMPIGRYEPFELDQDGEPTDVRIYEFEQCYGGDTFITKFAVNTGGLVWFYPYKRDADASINRPFRTSSQRGYGHSTPGPEGDNPLKAEGWDFRSCHYYFVESEINTYYRHRPEDEDRQTYFPFEPSATTNLEEFFAWAGNIRAYNGLYSFENALREFFVRGSTDQQVSAFENRTIYSEEAQNDSVVDAYRSFLVNDYYDLPSHTGPIWDTFVHLNILYMHTPKSCWRTFAEPAATLQGGNIAEVILGTGSLFARPSQEVLSTSGGYGGSISQWGGVHTHMGYVFPDVLQGKVFLLGINKNGGSIMNDISLQGLYTYFSDNMPTDLIKINGEFDLANVTTDNANLIDNPYKDIGFIGGYDYKNRRMWLIKKGKSGFTVSYSALMESWSSFHTYSPVAPISMDNRVFFMKEDDSDELKMWEMNIGPKGNFFDQVYDSELTMAVPTGEAMSFSNLIIHANSTNGTVRQKGDFFSTIQVTSDRQNTTEQNFVDGNGFAPVKQVNEVFFKFRNDRYQVAVPRDAVVNNDQDQFDLNNIWVPFGGTVDPNDPSVNEDYVIRERIKGEYATFKFKYSNVPDNTFVLREIRSIFERNVR